MPKGYSNHLLKIPVAFVGVILSVAKDLICYFGKRSFTSFRMTRKAIILLKIFRLLYL